MTSADTFAPGTLFRGRYFILDRPIHGSMAMVIRVMDLRQGRTCALKIPHHRLPRHARLRLYREARALQACRHPHLVVLHDILDGPALLMEWIEGRNLAQVVEGGGPLPLDRALALAHQLAGALGALHREGVVNRDLKAENVIIDASGRAVMVDLGISWVPEVLSELTLQGTALGTLEYMAPEQAAGQPPHPDMDIYALGGLLYYLVMGHLPRKGSPKEMLLALTRPALPPLEGAPPALRPILERSLHPNPKRRFRTVGEMASALGRLLMAVAFWPSSPSWNPEEKHHVPSTYPCPAPWPPHRGAPRPVVAGGHHSGGVAGSRGGDRAPRPSWRWGAGAHGAARCA